MESPRPEDKEALRRRLQELQQQHAAQQAQQPGAGATLPSKQEPPVSPPPELSDMDHRFLRQYLSPGEAVTITSHRRGAGPWYHSPVLQHTFQSSKPNVRVTVTPRHGDAVEYVFTSRPSGRLIQIPTRSSAR